MSRALQNLRIPKAARKLMTFYASRSDGFRPSLKYINQETGINPKHVSTIRQLLRRYGLIGYDGYNVIIDWVRLKAFASLDPSLMGKKKNWSISPIDLDSPEYSKNGVHTYIESLNSEDKKIYKAYVATAQALLDGVVFPEYKDKPIPVIDPDILKETKNGVYTYIEDESFYEPQTDLEEDDLSWVYQVPVVDAYGEIVDYAHYDTNLPF